jgi:hypothetical protein
MTQLFHEHRVSARTEGTQESLHIGGVFTSLHKQQHPARKEAVDLDLEPVLCGRFTEDTQHLEHPLPGGEHRRIICGLQRDHIPVLAAIVEPWFGRLARAA